MKKFLLPILAALAFFPVLGETLQDKLLFRLSFENGNDADFARGDGRATVHGEVLPVAGVDGEARRFSNRGDYLEFSAPGNFNFDSGAVAMWIKDIDAAPSNYIWNPYFQLTGPREAFNLTRLWQQIEWSGGLWRNGKKAAIVCDQAPLVITVQDTWTHLALVWQKRELVLYVNGLPAGFLHDAEFVFTEPGERFTIGRVADAWKHTDGFHTGSHMLTDAPERAKAMQIGEEPFGAYAVDEVAVFDAPLSAAEVAELARGGVARALDFRDEFTPGSVRPALVNSKRMIRVLPLALRRPEGCAAVRAAALDDAGATAAEAEVPWDEHGPDYAWLDLAAAPDGRYRVRMEYLDGDGSPIAATPEVPVDLTPDEEWLDNDLGREDVVLPGLEPLSADRDTLRFWGRELTGFAASLFPAQIVNQGHPMLAAPVAWRSGGEPLTFSAVELESVSPTRAVYRGAGSVGELGVSGTLTAEYDGFMLYRLTFTPPESGVTVDDLIFSVPFLPEEATLLFAAEMRRAAWPEERLELPVTPLYRYGVITVGTPERCFQWLTESDQYYYPADAPDVLRATTTPEAHLFEVAVIARPKRLEEPFTLEFALQTGPVKARPPHWRGWTYKKSDRAYLDPELHNPVAHTYTWWARSPGEPIPADGFPAERDPALLPDEIPCVSMHFGGYRHIRETDPDKRTPEWAKYEAEWQRIPTRINPQTAPGWNEQTIDTRSKSWGDWHVWGVDRLFRTTGVRGLYYDDWLQGDSSNQLAGSGYIGEDGTRRATHDIFNQREFHRRVYALVKKYRPDDGIVTIHTSGCIYLPVVSFCDLIYDGEVMIWRDRIPPEGNYFDTYDPSILQMLLTAKQYGPVQGLHDMTWGQAATDIGTWYQLLSFKQRQLWALLLANDIQVHGGFSQGFDTLRYLWLDHFGIAESDVAFLPYWEPEPAIRFSRAWWERPGGPEPDNSATGYASAYTRPGQALAVLIRDSDNNYYGEAECEYLIDRARLGLPPEGALKCTDLESFGRTPKGRVEDDRLIVPVGVDDFSLILIERAD